MKKSTRKEFREILNKWYQDTKHKHYRYHQITRSFGDYLYYQDREKFDFYYFVWSKGDTKSEFESKV